MRSTVALLLAAAMTFACTSAPQPIAPHWDAIPPWVLGALCKRLQMDALGTSGRLTVVKTTQPIATPDSVSIVAASARRPVAPSEIAAAIREGGQPIPLAFTEGECAWSPVDGLASIRSDEVVVELSSPLRNPAVPGEAGLFARVSLGTQQEWYWVTLAPRGSAWAVRYVSAIGH